MKEAHAADLRTFARARARQDSTKKPATKDGARSAAASEFRFRDVGTQYVKVPIDKIPPGADLSGTSARAGRRADARAPGRSARRR